MKGKELEIVGDTRFVIKRLSIPEEKETVSLNELQALDSKESYRLIAGVPKGIPIEEEPAENVEELIHKTEKPDKYSLAFFDQLEKLRSATSEIRYKSKDGIEKETSLLSTIGKAWKQHLYEYGNIEREEDYVYVNTGGPWIIISALGEIIHREKLDEAFIKLQEEGEIRWVGEDPKLRCKAQYLVRHGLAKYIPEWPSNIRWELKKFDSFHDFHQTVMSLIDKYRVEQQEKNQPSLILEEAYVVLKKMRQEKEYPEISYQREEQNLWSLYQQKNESNISF